MNNKDYQFQQILDLVSSYAESNEDFEYIIANIEQMQENFNESEDD